MGDAERLRGGLEAAVRAAKLAVFIMGKHGTPMNDSWRAGFDRDLMAAEAAMAPVGLDTPAWKDRAERLRTIWRENRERLVPLLRNRLAVYAEDATSGERSTAPGSSLPERPMLAFVPHRKRDLSRGIYLVWIECEGVLVDGPDAVKDPAPLAAPLA